MFKQFRHLPLLGFLAIGFLFCQPSPTQRYLMALEDQEPMTFTILQINDVYEIAPLEGGKVGGLARVAGLLRQLEAENPNTIAVLAGDFLSPSFMGTLKLDNGERVAGLQMIETLNALGMDYVTFGNHEFDFSDGKLVEKRLAACDFRFVSANARYRDQSGSLRPFLQGTDTVPDYLVHTFTMPNGRELRVALTGVVLPFSQQNYVHYLDVTDAFRSTVQEANRNAHLTVGITHLAIDQDEALAAAITDVPLFMGGHDHDHMSRYVGGTVITKADANAKTVYVHRITYYPASDATKINSELVYITPDTPSDPAVETVVQQWQTRVNGLVEAMGFKADEVLATLREPLDGREASVRNMPTNYGLLTNQALEYAWPGADAYVFNSGSLRVDDKLSGTITAYDVLRSFPFGGGLVAKTLPGDALQRMLTIGNIDNRGEGGYLQRLHADWTNGQWEIKGELLDPAKTYRVVMPQFLASGKEARLGFLADYPDEALPTPVINGTATENDIRNVVMAYFKSGY